MALLPSGPFTMTPELAAEVFRLSKFRVMRDPGGAIVATWDEGRWWTPSESDQFAAQLVAELTGS